MGKSDLEFEISRFDVRPEARSRLICLPPIGIGTARAEGLTSYIVRLAWAHSVSPKRLVRAAFAAVEPEIANVLERGSFFSWGGRSINGLGPYAQLFSQAATALTCARDLRFLTMLPLQGLIPENSKGLLVRYPRWCPACFGEMAASQEAAYRPLAWSFNLYQYCGVHQRPLADRCPTCGKHQHVLPTYPSLDHCSHCQAWLGEKGASTDSLPPAEKWVCRAIEDIVSNLPHLEGLATRERFLESLNASIRVSSEGNVTEFCRSIGVQAFNLRGWLTKCRPSFLQWLAVCYGMNVWPNQFLSEMEERVVSGHPLRQRPLILRYRRQRPQLSREAQRMLKDELARIAADPQSIVPLSAIARRLRLDMGTLKYWAPENCKRIRDRYAQAMRIKGEQRRAREIEMVGNLVKGLVEEGDYPSVRKINLELRKRGKTLMQPELRQAYREAMSRYR